MMRVRGTCQIPQPWHIWKYINTRGSFIKRKHSWTRRTLTHRFRDGVDDPREADGIVYLLLLEEEVNLRPMRLEYLNEIHPEPTLTCSLSSFCCSLLLLSSSSTLLTWMNRSFCSQTEFKYSTQEIRMGPMHLNTSCSYLFCFQGFHMKPFGKPESKTMTTWMLHMWTNNIKKRSVKRHSLPVQGLVDQLSLEPEMDTER